MHAQANKVLNKQKTFFCFWNNIMLYYNIISFVVQILVILLSINQLTTAVLRGKNSYKINAKTKLVYTADVCIII